MSPLYRPGPHTLRCPKCKAGENHLSRFRTSGLDIVRTEKPPRERWCAGRLKVQHEVKHERCGWVWWTTHPSAKSYPTQQGNDR